MIGHSKPVVFYLLLGLACSGCRPVEPGLPVLEDQISGTDQLLIGLSPIDESTVWTSGTGGTVLRTIDGGITWEDRSVEGADTLQFRDVHGVSADTAYVLSAGEGDRSRIFKSVDGGETWQLQFVNRENGGFLDCFDFWDAEHGLAFSDSIGDSLYIITTADGGAHWQRLPHDVLPAAQPGEGGFAASGRCVMVTGDSTAFIGTGAGGSARILKTEDRGKTWASYETPITDTTDTSGIMSLSFLDEQIGLASGGELAGPDQQSPNIAYTIDGGVTWTPGNPPQLPDIYGCSYAPGEGDRIVAAGPKGLDVSTDGGDSWISLSKMDHWSVGFATPDVGWAVGPSGRVTRITW